MSKKTILLTSIVVIICILALIFGLVFGIKCTVTLEHFYKVSEDTATTGRSGYFDAKAWGKTYCFEKVTRCSHYNPYTPSRDGYVFGGWYQDAAFTVPFIPGTKVTHDITIYAKWIPIEQ